MNPVHTADLNLLRVLDALLEEENVTRAAARLELTQSALSRALARLRRLLGDELLLPTGRGMRPTARALELRPRVRAALGDVERLFSESRPFEPATARRRFRIAAVDYAHAVLLAPLLRAVATEAPAVGWELLPTPRPSDRTLENGEVDLSLEPRRASGAGVVWSTLLEERYACLVWRDHPMRRLDRTGFAGLPHAMVAPWGRPGGVVDEALAATRARRRIAVQVPSFLLLPHVLVGTERVATVPRRIALLLATAYPLRVLEPPVRVPGFTLCLAWHEIHRHDPAHVWLRARVQRQARELGDAGA